MNQFRWIRQSILRLLQQSLIQDSAWMLLSQGLGVFAQAAYFILIARALDTASYGAFIGVAAIASIVFPFIGLGSGNILIKNVSKSQELFGEQWGNALLISLLTSIPVVLAILAGSSVLFSTSLPLAAIALLLIGDLVGLRFLEISSAAFVSVFQVKRAAQIKMLYNISKLAAAIALVVCFRNPNILIWSVLYCVSSLFPAIVAFLLIYYSIGKPDPNITKYKSELGQGLLFSVDLSAVNISSNVDKAMLSSLAGLQIAGIYGAGYRFIDICYYIIFALSGATYARFFKHGATGIKGSFGFAKKLLPIAALYGIFTTTILFLFAPIIVPLMLGKEYVDSIAVLQLLSPLHLVSYIQLLAADILTGAGFQGSRSVIQVTTALLNISLNIWLIPLYSWKGAAFATLTSEFLKTAALWVLIFFCYNHDTTASKQAE